MANKASTGLSPSVHAPCKDCKKCTTIMKEWYVVNDVLWTIANKGKIEGYLCIGCIEKRIGRKLDYLDFQPMMINVIDGKNKSERLVNRLSPQSGEFVRRAERMRDTIIYFNTHFVY